MLGNENAEISSYVQHFIERLHEGTIPKPTIWSSSWSVLRWPLFIMVLSFLPFGRLGIPVLLAIRGFLLSFCMASFIMELGGKGLLLMTILLGVESFLSIPVLFIFGIEGWNIAVAIKERKGRREQIGLLLQNRVAFLRFAICAAVLIVCILWEVFLSPLILSASISFFPLP